MLAAGVSHQQRIVRIGNRIVLRLYQKTGRCGRCHPGLYRPGAVGRLARLRPHQQTMGRRMAPGRQERDHRIDQRGAVGGGGLVVQRILRRVAGKRRPIYG